MRNIGNNIDATLYYISFHVSSSRENDSEGEKRLIVMKDLRQSSTCLTPGSSGLSLVLCVLHVRILHQY